MYDSGMTAKAVIDEVKAEADIALEIPDRSYISWLNSLEQILYGEIIREQKKAALTGLTDTIVQMEQITQPEEEAPIRFDDIYSVFAGSVQLIESTVTSGMIFPNTYYKDENSLSLHVTVPLNELTVIYFVRPAMKTESSYASGHVMVPAEFIDLVKAKLRGEAYKLANEDALAAKWLNDYNILLENFKAWVAGRTPNFGL